MDAASGRFKDDCPECGEYECVCRAADRAPITRDRDGEGHLGITYQPFTFPIDSIRLYDE
jgi:hypothetical protein